MATEEQLELAPEDYRPDAWEDGSVLFDGVRFESREHARWAYVLTKMNVGFEYQPQHFGITIDVGIRPTFRLKRKFGTNGPEGFLHCVEHSPSGSTQFCCHYLAHDTGLPVWVAVGPIRPPSRSDGPMMILWTTGTQFKRRAAGLDTYQRFEFCLHDDPSANDFRLVQAISRAQESFVPVPVVEKPEVDPLVVKWHSDKDSLLARINELATAIAKRADEQNTRRAELRVVRDKLLKVHKRGPVPTPRTQKAFAFGD